MLPTAGGWYVYSRRAFGENIGFVVGCCDWTMQCVGNAYMAVALGDFTAGLFPNLVAHVQLVAVTGLALLALLNWLGLRTGSYAQELTSLAKAIGLIALVILCFTISPKSGISAPSVEHGWNRAKLLSTNGRSRFRASSITGFDFRLWASLFLTKSLVFLTILTFSPWYRINRRAKSTRFLVRSVPALDSCKQSI
jgi:amino acid transporter